MVNIETEIAFDWKEFCDYAARSGVSDDQVLEKCRELMLHDADLSLRLGWDCVIEAAVSGRSLQSLSIMFAPLPFESIVDGSDEPRVDLFSEHSFTPGSIK